MKKIMLFMVGVFSIILANSQDTLRNKKDGNYLFTIQKTVPVNAVQNQCKSGTCWTYSTLSFLESEIIRSGKGNHNLSEMFIVNKAYKDKADWYVRMHGSSNFGAGGAFHDIPYVIEKYGIVPEQVYTGLNYGTEEHNHNEMDEMLKQMLTGLVDNKLLTDGWQKAVDAVVDSYLGVIPETFTYEGKSYTPTSYAQSLGLNMKDYIPLTSFTHHPFYSKFILEVPDNWIYEKFHNVPLNELIETIDNAIMNGYTVAWASDVSEKGFSFKNGVAIVPEDADSISVVGKDSKYFNDGGADKNGAMFDSPVKEMEITQEIRQKAYDNYETTDDHGMHIVGIVKDQFGTTYYQVKNSWGTKNDCNGYLYVSESFMKYKTMDILVHKNAIPKALLKKLNITN